MALLIHQDTEAAIILEVEWSEEMPPMSSEDWHRMLRGRVAYTGLFVERPSHRPPTLIELQELQGYVDNGLRWLDRYAIKGWERDINLADLNLASGGMCILGQLYGSFSDGQTLLDMTHDDTALCGFVIALDSPLQRVGMYEHLTHLWREAIAARRIDKALSAGAK